MNMPKNVEYEHKGALFEINIPFEWDEYDDYLEINGIKFLKTDNLIGFFEIFSRLDYSFGGLDDCIFLDVGANIGDSALFAAQQENISHIYAYEPFQQAYQTAIKNIDLNPELKNKITIYPYGWYNVDCDIKTDEINDINASAVNTILSDYAIITDTEKTHKTTVKLKKSSDLLQEIITKHQNQPIILKMDIEGAEYDCITELHKTGLLENIDLIFIEWHKKGSKPITDILEKYGFIWFDERLTAMTGFIRAIKK